ncbi:MAG TPA: hypothetical protein VJN48_00540, partial [Terriglobales bacterium]|nr:hypothetical protein [Terriglobales bacterium]
PVTALSNPAKFQDCALRQVIYTASRWWFEGGVGGTFQGSLAKSKNSVISIWAASRRVKLGELNRVSPFGFFRT